MFRLGDKGWMNMCCRDGGGVPVPDTCWSIACWRSCSTILHINILTSHHFVEVEQCVPIRVPYYFIKIFAFQKRGFTGFFKSKLCELNESNC